MDRLKAVMGQDIWPDWVFGIRGMGHDPKALVWMVDEGDEFARGVADRPSTAEEIERIIGV